ncbi:MAG: hypothetical protein RLZZ587_443 [Actinomycetota bacterium]
MSKAFLDSHVALWLANGSWQLSDNALHEINRHSARAVSALTFAEFDMKSRLGAKFDLVSLRQHLEANHFEVESYGIDAAFAIARFPFLSGHDPFDRMIFSQAASQRNTTFFTADRKLLALGLDWVHDARS